MMNELDGNTSGLSGGYGRRFASEWYARFGQLQDRMGRPANAEANYRKALARQPSLFNALSGLARLLLRGRRYDEAAEIWRKVVGLRPDSAALNFQLSRALHRSGQAEQAATHYLRVVALNPAHEKAFAALDELATHFARAGAPAENRHGLESAARIGQELLALHPQLPRARDSAAAIAQTISAAATEIISWAPEDALAHFNVALALAPDLLEAARGAALCFEQLGQPEEALAILERQIEINPNAIEPRLLRERIGAFLKSLEVKQNYPLDARQREALLAHARQLITGDPDGSTIDAILDPKEREAILARARRLITGDPDGSTTEAILDPREREAILARARRLITGDPDGSMTEAVLDPQEREAILARARRLIAGDSDGSTTEAVLDPREREAILARARRLITGDPDGSTTEAILDPREREAILARARRLITGDPDGSTTEAILDPREREAILARARRLITGDPDGSTTEAILDPREREAILARARRLITGDPDGSTTEAILDPREREAILARARRLITGDPDGSTTEAILDPREREAILARARRLIAGDRDGSTTEAILDPQEREAILARARRLIAGDPDGSTTEAILDPREREAILARARRLITGDPDGSTTEAILDPQEREAILARARRLIAGDPDGSTTEAILDPREREAILARARRLIAGDPDGSTTEAILDPQEREAILARARRLIAGDPDGSTTEAILDPQEREAILARARRLISGDASESAPEAILDPLEREAILAQARRLIRGDQEGSTTEAILDPQEREATLARAQRLITGDAGESAPEAVLEPQEREAILARAQRLITGDAGESAPEAVLDPQEREAILARAQRLLGKPVGNIGGSASDPQTRAELLARARGIAQSSAMGEEGRAEQPSIPKLLQSAQSAYNDARLEEAEELNRQVLARDGANFRALSNLARLYMRQQRWSDAIDVLVRLNILQPKSIEPKRLLARALLQDGQLEAAARAYVNISILEPDDPDVWQSLGQLQRRLSNWAAARIAWTRLVEITPDRPEPRFELAWACHQAGDGDTAQAALQGILATDPDHRPALALLGRIRLTTDPEGSLVCWLRLAELDPAAVEPRLQSGRINLRQQRLKEAEADFTAVLKRDPGHAQALASLAGIISQRDPEEAVSMLVRWSKRDTEAVAPWLAIGRLHARSQRPDLAEPAFRRVLDLAPSNLEALTGLGRIHSIGGRPDEALSTWRRLAELAPETAEPRLQIARIHHARHDPETEDALRAVLSVDPQNREALRHLAQLQGRTRATVDRALDTWQRLAELDPAAVFPMAQRGRLLERVGRFDEAETEYRSALARDGRHSMALGDLARFYRVQRRWDDAAEIYRAHLKLDPDRLDVIIGLGQCLDRRDRLQEAEELYSRALALDPDNVTALGYRGRLLRTRGQVDGAIADFYRICALEPSNADAWHELIFQLAGAERESEALAVLAKAEQALGDTPEACLALARAAAAALFEQRAIAYFARAIAAEPANPSYHAQLGLHFLRQGVLDGAFHHLLDSRDLDPKNVDVAKGLFDVTRALAELGFDHVAMRAGQRTFGEILVPERLFEHVTRLAESIAPYDPVPRSIVAISATLAPGGAERQMANMLRGLSDPVFGLDLALFCISLAPRLRRNFFLPVLEGTGVEVVSLDAASVENCLWHPDVAPFAGLIRHFPSDIVTPIAFWLQEFRRRRPEVVHAWQDSTNLTAVVAALLAGVPRIVLCCRSVRPDNPRRRLRRFMQKAYEAVLAHPAVVLSNNSRAGANDYAEWLGMAPQRIEVVYNGVDFDRLRAHAEETDNARLKLGIPAGAQVLGGVFRMSEEKRPLLWIDVAAAVARRDEAVHFVICGDGPMRDEMINRAAALGIGDRVHLPGAQANIGSWYKMMNVVMLTSRHEGLPNVLLEAQSLGIPVVAPDVGGMSEVVEQGVTGWTVRDADAESLAERVLHCLSDPTWRQAAGERAPVFVRDRFSIPAMLRRNLEVYGISPDSAAPHDR